MAVTAPPLEAGAAEGVGATEADATGALVPVLGAGAAAGALDEAGGEPADAEAAGGEASGGGDAPMTLETVGEAPAAGGADAEAFLVQADLPPDDAAPGGPTPGDAVMVIVWWTMLVAPEAAPGGAEKTALPAAGEGIGG